MPKFVIEAQYLLPVYKHEVVEAPDLATACRGVIDNDNWDFAENDYDNARATAITEAVEIPEDYQPDYNKFAAVGSPAAHALYSAGLPKLPIPAEFAGDELALHDREWAAVLHDRELAAVLAGLRLFQSIASDFGGSVDWPVCVVTIPPAGPTMADIGNIATSGEQLEPLTSSETEALCERLNRPLAAPETGADHAA
jgi:hypothetical protein